MFISHGLAEHCGWHSVYAEKLAEEGVLVFGHDHGNQCSVLLAVQRLEAIHFSANNSYFCK